MVCCSCLLWEALEQQLRQAQGQLRHFEDQAPQTFML